MRGGAPAHSVAYRELLKLSRRPFRGGQQLLGGRVRGMLPGPRPTRSSWSRPAARRGGPSRGGTHGTGRTCGTRSADGRSAGSGCTRAHRTWACGRPSRSGTSSPPSVLLEGVAEVTKQGASLVVRGRRGDHGDVHAPDPVDLVLVDLVEHDLLRET